MKNHGFPDTIQVLPKQPVPAFTKDMGHHIGDPLHAMYGEHALRAKVEGFKQMPYGKYIQLHIKLYWGD